MSTPTLRPSVAGASNSGPGVQGDLSKKRDAPAASVEILARGAFPKNILANILDVVSLLCPDTAHFGPFREWDRVFTIAPDARGAARTPPIRLRKSLSKLSGSDNEQTPATPFAQPWPWSEYLLMYYGLLDRRVAAPLEKRPVQKVSVGRDAPKILECLGFVLSHQYIRRGWRFRTRSGLLVDAYFAEKLSTSEDPDSANFTAFPTVTLPTGDIEATEETFGIVEVSSDQGHSPEDILEFLLNLGSVGLTFRK